MVKESKASQEEFSRPREELKNVIGVVGSLGWMHFLADLSGGLGFGTAPAQCFGSVESSQAFLSHLLAPTPVKQS